MRHRARRDYYEPKDSEEVTILDAGGNLVRLRQPRPRRTPVRLDR